MFRLFFVLIFTLGLLVAPFISNLKGIVNIEVSDYSIQINLIFFCFLWLISIILIYLIEFVCRSLYKLITCWRSVITKYRKKKATKKIHLALEYLKIGNYKKANKLFKKNIKYVDEPLVYLIDAANAAQNLNDFDSAQQFLNEAEVLTSADNLMLNIAKIELFIASEQFNKAENLLEQQLPKNPKNPKLLKLATIIYTKQQNPIKLEEALQKSKNYQVLNQSEYELINEQLEDEITVSFNKINNVEDIISTYNNLSDEQKSSLKIKELVINKLLAYNKDEYANQFIYKNISSFTKDQEIFDRLIKNLNNYSNILNKKVLKELTKVYDEQPDNYNLIKLLALTNQQLGYQKNARKYFDLLVDNNSLTQLDDYKTLLDFYQKINDQDKITILKDKINQLL